MLNQRLSMPGRTQCHLLPQVPATAFVYWWGLPTLVEKANQEFGGPARMPQASPPRSGRPSCWPVPHRWSGEALLQMQLWLLHQHSVTKSYQPDKPNHNRGWTTCLVSETVKDNFPEMLFGTVGATAELPKGNAFRASQWGQSLV